MSDQRAEEVEPRVGQVWEDNDPRGGPTFRIVMLGQEHVWVTDLDGKRRRKIQRKRLRPNARGYRLVSG